MKAIVGLGNPGPKYQLHRHNLGFIVLDALVKRNGLASFREEFGALVSKSSLDGHQVLLIKPQSYMNLSGQPVRALMDYYKLTLTEMIVVHDEIDIPFGEMRFQFDRGPAGHNGIKSIHQHMSSGAYDRLKLGVGRPPHPEMSVANFLLSDFSQTEMNLLSDFVSLACEALEYYLDHQLTGAANRYNSMSVNS